MLQYSENVGSDYTYINIFLNVFFNIDYYLSEIDRRTS